jgi:hypothetical protein
MGLAPLPLFLVLMSGACWTLVYLDGIRLGLRDHTYAMPFWALALNVAWELLNAVLGYQQMGLTLQVGINAVWFLCDCGILFGLVGGEGMSGPNAFILVIGVLCSLFDLIYIKALAQTQARERRGEAIALAF